ncbi:sulfatase [Methanocella sp. CWC-04]|uniref:Sulfatase n=1 Tax=Methanooceanicella nereidis TaxID=2052831 RepID=A0AAP2W5D4_9EURY|nr:arylsulfatase [Methanocella sp. CWC-04]MCD1294193.1 sulfatase [Methanocella sp. CWC-04]
MVNGKRTYSTDEFRGTIGRTYAESEPWWPEQIRSPPGAPNILIIVLDDVGFGQMSCYGGPVETPNMDKLAANGLRYNNFHTTALCSPTRACLLTGRNHHSVGMASITELATGFPGYNGRMPKDKATVAAMLRENGYNTFCLGKWHNTPDNETGPAGPYDRWPTGEMMGFDRFYGFLGGECNQYAPSLYWDNHPIEPPKLMHEGYHLSEDLADTAKLFIANHESVAPDKPWFMFLAFGACHAPHHVPEEWSDKYKGKFDKGWDKAREETLARQKKMGIVPKNTELAPPNPGVQAWKDLSADEKKLFARFMEVFAGFLSHTDHQIGKLVEFLKEIGDLDNTLIFIISDNGASAEGGLTGSVNEMRWANAIPETVEESLDMIDEIGGPRSYNHYPVGWTQAGNTPFKWYKQYTHYGGIKDPMVVHWPMGISARGEIRSQFHHAIDIVPTILEAVGIEPPEEIGGYQQKRIEGVSMLYSFNDGKVPTKKPIQYFEMLGNRAIWYNGWKAVTYHGRLPWESGSRWTFDEDKWELYNVEDDFSECHDLADKHPEKLRELVELWWAEAGKYNVLPLDDRFHERIQAREELEERTKFTFYPGAVRIPEGSAPNVKNRSHTITAYVEIPKSGAEGVICAIGGVPAGWSLYIKDKKLVYCHNFVGTRYYVRSDTNVPSGEVKIGFEFKKTGENTGKGILTINDKKVGEAKIPHTVPHIYSASESFDIGCDFGSPVTEEYNTPFKFTGTIKKVLIELSGKKHLSPEAETKVAMMRQ